MKGRCQTLATTPHQVLNLAVHEYHVQHNTEATEKKSYDAVQGFEYNPLTNFQVSGAMIHIDNITMLRA